MANSGAARPLITYVIEHYPSAVAVEQFPEMIGGAELQAERVAKLLSSDFALQVVSQRPQGVAARENVDGVTVHRVRLSTRGGKVGAAQILGALVARGLRTGRPAIVQGFQVNATTLAAAALSLLWRVPLVIKATHRYNFDRRVGRRRQLQLDFLLRTASAVVVPSRTLLGVAEASGVSAAKLHYIPNGVDAEYFLPPDAETRVRSRRQLGYADEDFVFLWIGRFDPFKGLDSLLPVWSRVRAQEPRVRLLLVGDGEDESVAQRLVSSHPETIQRLHFRRDVRSLYHCADALLLTTRGEGLSNTLLEAIACGLSAVVSAVPENLEVGDGAEFLLRYDSRGEKDLEAALLRAVEQRPERDALAAQARERAESAYSLQATAAQWGQLYGSLVSGPGSVF